MTGRAPDGPVVAIETSGWLGSVAVAVGGSVVARRFLTERAGHASGLMPAVQEVLEEGGTGLPQVAGVVVGAGPGSFTGVRIAGAAAKGLASGLGVPLYAASSLQAASFAVEAFAGDPQALEDAIADAGLGPEVGLGPKAGLGPDAGPGPEAGLGPEADGDRGAIAGRGDDREVRYVLFDARNGRVYGACYDVDANGPTEVAAPHGGTILEVLNGRPPLGTCFMGDGAVAHAALIHAAGYEIRPSPAGIAIADAVVKCCRWEPVDVADWQPDYVREWRPG